MAGTQTTTFPPGKTSGGGNWVSWLFHQVPHPSPDPSSCDPNRSATHHLLRFLLSTGHHSITERHFFKVGGGWWIAPILVKEFKGLFFVGVGVFFTPHEDFKNVAEMTDGPWFDFFSRFCVCYSSFWRHEVNAVAGRWKWSLYSGSLLINSLDFHMVFFFLVWIRTYIGLLTAAFKILEVCVRGGDLPCSRYPPLRSSQLSLCRRKTDKN